nr:NS4.9 protein [Bovine coronavirus]
MKTKFFCDLLAPDDLASMTNYKTHLGRAYYNIYHNACCLVGTVSYIISKPAISMATTIEVADYTNIMSITVLTTVYLGVSIGIDTSTTG